MTTIKIEEINFTELTREQFLANPVCCYGHLLNYKNVYGDLVDKINLMNSLTTKEEYLSWVKEWKKAYKKLSKASRMYKLLRKDIHSGGVDFVKYRASENVQMLKWHAYKLLVLREKSKEIAREAYAHKMKELEAA